MTRLLPIACLSALLAFAPCAHAQDTSDAELQDAITIESAITAIPFAVLSFAGLLTYDALTQDGFDEVTGKNVMYLLVPTAGYLLGWLATWPTVAAAIDDDGELRSAVPWILPLTFTGLTTALLTTIIITQRPGGEPLSDTTLDVLTPTTNALYAGAALYSLGALIARDSANNLDFTDPLAIGLGAGGLALGALIGLIPQSRSAQERFLWLPLAVTAPGVLLGSPTLSLFVDLAQGSQAPRMAPESVQIGYVGLTASLMLVTLLTLGTVELVSPTSDEEDDGVTLYPTLNGFMLTW